MTLEELSAKLDTNMEYLKEWRVEEKENNHRQWNKIDANSNKIAWLIGITATLTVLLPIFVAWYKG